MEFRGLNLIIASLLLVVSTSASALVVISDLDDTIKVTNTRNFQQAAYNAMFSTKAYAGMPELMQEMGNYTNGLYYVSASPKILSSRIQKFFRKNSLIVAGFYTRALRQLGEKERFKINAISDILDSTEEDVILLGDDSQLDEKIYSEIDRLYPNRVQAVYIHNVYNSDRTSSALRYFTAFDIAVGEYHARRMTFSQVSEIAKGLVSEKNMAKYFPKFAHCPQSFSEFRSYPLSKITALMAAVNTKIVAYCKLRAKPSVD